MDEARDSTKRTGMSPGGSSKKAKKTQGESKEEDQGDSARKKLFGEGELT